MIIKIPISDVDKLVNSVLSERTDVTTYQREESNKPSKIIYTLTLNKPSTQSWIITIYQMTIGTEIIFPIYVPSFGCIRANQIQPGAVIEILENEKEPVYDDPIDKVKYKLCRSVWQILRLYENEVPEQQQQAESIEPLREVVSEELIVEPTKSQDIRIAKRRGKVKELSEKGKTVNNIAKLAEASIATIVRDRKFLGIAVTRGKHKP
jgi:hypothetical protein